LTFLASLSKGNPLDDAGLPTKKVAANFFQVAIYHIHLITTDLNIDHEGRQAL
jgi:hypothetical protein